jgi:hypothetical protein
VQRLTTGWRTKLPCLIGTLGVTVGGGRNDSFILSLERYPYRLCINRLPAHLGAWSEGKI